MVLKLKAKVEYSFVSPGTEGRGSNGYMSLTEPINNFRYICPEPHSKKTVVINQDALSINKKMDIESIILSRFQLISSLASEHFNEHSLIVGGGAVGLSTCLEFLRLGIKPTLLTRRKSLKDTLDFLKINIINHVDFGDYKVIIDTTGELTILKGILDQLKPNTKLILLGTPTNGPDLSLIDVHRNNIQIVGAHEIRGIDYLRRQRKINIISNWYLEKPFTTKNLVSFHMYSQKIIKDILEKKYPLPYHVLIH